jgi:hypothetical protein
MPNTQIGGFLIGSGNNEDAAQVLHPLQSLFFLDMQ